MKRRSDRVNALTLKEPEEIKLAMQVVVLRDKWSRTLRKVVTPGCAGPTGRAA